MNTSISDINYSLTSGKYSALNSKLYLMDAFDARMDDGASAQSATYESTRDPNEGNPNSQGVEQQFAEHQDSAQSNAIVNNNNVVAPDTGEAQGAEAAEANPSSNHINAVTSSTPVMGINEEAMQNMAMALGEGAAANAFGGNASGGVSNGGQNLSSSSSQTNVSNSSNTTTIDGHEGSTTVNNTYNNSTVYNQNTYNFGEGPGGIEINITQISNVINNTINNIVYNGDHIINNVIDIDSVVNNVLNNNILNDIDINLGDLGDVINNTTNILGDVLGDTTTLLGNILNNTTNTVVNLTNEVLGDLLGKIDFTLDIDLGLNTDLLNQLNIGDLSNTLNLLNDNILKSVVFDLNSDLLDLHLDSATLFNSPLVTNLETQVSDLLNHVDGITSNIPLVNTVDNLLDNLTADLPIDQLTVGLLDQGTIDPTNLLNITNSTTLTEDLGTALSFDDNALHNSLNILNDEGLQVNDLLQLNNTDLLDTVNGVTPLDNLDQVVDDLQGDIVNDTSNLLDEVLGGNNADSIPGVDPVINTVNNVLDDIINTDGGTGVTDSVENLINLGDSSGVEESNPLNIVDNLLDQNSSSSTDENSDAGSIVDQVLNSLPENLIETSSNESNIVDNIVNNVVGDDNPITNIINQLESNFTSNTSDNTSSQNNVIDEVTNLLNSNDSNPADAIFDTIASTINEAPVAAPEAAVNDVDMGGITSQVNDVLDHHVGGLLDHIGI